MSHFSKNSSISQGFHKFQLAGLSQYENQNVTRPNNDFCHFVVDFEKFFVGDRLECQKSMF